MSSYAFSIGPCGGSQSLVPSDTSVGTNNAYSDPFQEFVAQNLFVPNFSVANYCLSSFTISLFQGAGTQLSTTGLSNFVWVQVDGSQIGASGIGRGQSTAAGRRHIGRADAAGAQTQTFSIPDGLYLTGVAGWRQAMMQGRSLQQGISGLYFQTSDGAWSGLYGTDQAIGSATQIVASPIIMQAPAGFQIIGLFGTSGNDPASVAASNTLPPLGAWFAPAPAG